MFKKIIVTVFVLFSYYLNAQSSEGYWDNVRVTTETLSLRAGEKEFIKTQDFPEGTTEIVFRITLLDDNQKLSSSLVSVLKSIPDPTGLSQGSAGAIFLLSTISGDDKCKYAIFNSSLDSENYIKTNKAINACYVQNKPINKEAKLLSSNCVSSKTQNLWFSFESDNWVMNQKIILEVVPWVNKNLSRGWNSDTKQEVIAISKTQRVYQSLSKKEEFSTFFLEAVSQKYTYKEYSNLLKQEKTVALNKITENCLIKTGEIKLYYSIFRDASFTAFLKGNFDDAIKILQEDIFDKKRDVALDYSMLGNYYLLSKQFDKAEKTFMLGIEKDASEINLQIDLAHLYLFTNRISEAKEIHKKYKNQNVNSKTSWIEKTKNDFEMFKKYNFPTNNYKKILRILE